MIELKEELSVLLLLFLPLAIVMLYTYWNRKDQVKS